MPLIVDRARLPEDWPTNRGSSAFWEQLGRTVATFSHLEDMMARAWFGLTATREFEDMEQAETAFPEWEKAVKETLTDSLYSLRKKLNKAFEDDDRVSNEVADAYLARLDELRVWRNALCHGAWQGFQEDGSVGLRHFTRRDKEPESLENCLSVETLFSIRAATVDATADLVDILSAAGVRFPGTALPGAPVTDYMRNNRD